MPKQTHTGHMGAAVERCTCTHVGQIRASDSKQAHMLVVWRMQQQCLSMSLHNHGATLPIDSATGDARIVMGDMVVVGTS